MSVPTNLPSIRGRALRVSALIVSAGLLIASCGGDEASNAPPTSTAAPTVAPTTESVAASTSTSQPPAADENVLLQALTEIVSNADAAGGIVAVRFGSGETVVVATGVTDERSATPVPTDGVLAIASITKSYVAAILLDLEREGLVDLDAPIAEFLDWPHGDVITIRQLLDHTSGLLGWADSVSEPQFDAALLADLSANHSLAEVVELARSVPASGPPDGITRYSNAGYLLAGRIAEIVTGQSFAQLLNDRIVAPLGLTATYYPVGDSPTSGAPALPGSYEYAGGVLHTNDVPQTAYLSLIGPAAGAMSSVADLMVWARTALHDQRLGETDLTSMGTIGKGGVGLGVFGVDVSFGDCVFDGCPDDANFTVLALNGEVPGSSTRLWYDTVNDVTLFVYLNRDAVSLDAPMLELLADLTE